MSISKLSGASTYQPAMAAQSASTQQSTTKSTTEYKEGNFIQEVSTRIDSPVVSAGGLNDSQENESQSFSEGNGQKNQTDRIKKAVEDLNKKMGSSEVQFGIHEATNRVMIKIVDKETKEIIKELPAEKTLDMIAKAWEMAGILVDEKR